MSRRTTAIAALAGALALGAGAGCGGDDEGGGGGGGSGAAAKASFELRVGDVLPFTGDLAAYGPSLDKAARLAAQRINAAVREAGATGVSVRVVDSQDDETRPQAGVEAAQKLVQTDDVNVLVGSMASNVTLAIAESVALPDEVVMITPTSTAPDITDLQDDGLVWRVLASDTLQGSALAQAVVGAFGQGATVNVGARNDAFGTALKRIFVEEYRKRGGRVGVDETWNPESPNFATEAQRFAAGNPDGWVSIDFPETYERFGPALVRAGGWTPEKMFMTEAMRNEESLAAIGARATRGLRGTAPTSEGAPARQAFDRLFRAAPPKRPLTGFEGSAFDSVMLAFLAALKGGSSEPDTIKANLQAVSGPPGRKVTFEQLPEAIRELRAGRDIDYEGAWGPIDWDAKGDPSSAIYEVWRYAGGKITSERTFEFGGG